MNTVVVAVDLRMKLVMNQDAITNLRTNIDDRDLWDKARLCRAMGHRPWLPFTMVRDVKLNGVSASACLHHAASEPQLNLEGCPGGLHGLGPSHGCSSLLEWLQAEVIFCLALSRSFI